MISKRKEQQSSIGFRSLKDSEYRVHLTMAHESLHRVQDPITIIQLQLGDQNVNREVKAEKLCLEFSQEELSSFFEQLERVQSQLDSLG